jgi:hypothetical protein
MKFFALATLATTAFALKAKQDYENCLSEWQWDFCLGMWWQNDDCEDDCGWWVSPDLDDDWNDDWWMSCWDDYECVCDETEWMWDDEWEAWWRTACEENQLSDCGWIYWDDWEGEIWVDCSGYY